MSSVALLTALRVEVRSLVAWQDATALNGFVEAVQATQPHLGLSTSRLLHPAAGPCVAAFVGDAIVGIGALRLPGAGDGRPTLLVVVRPHWRRAGVATKLVRAIAHDETLAAYSTATAIVSRSNRAALALGRACGMHRNDLDDGRVELELEYGRSFRRCA